MRTHLTALIRGLVAGACIAAAASAQRDHLIGRVLDAGRHGLVDARVRAFALPRLLEPWRDPAVAVPVEARTVADGKFSLALDRRAALWIEAAGTGVFVPSAAPGVPVVVELAPLATVELGTGASGAFVRVDGVPVGFVAGERLDVPAGALEVLVESGARPFVAARSVRPGERVRIARPTLAPPRLVGVAATATASSPAWPVSFAPDAAGVVQLPASARPFLVRVATAAGGERCFDEVWLEPGGEQRAAAVEPEWRPVRVLDAARRPVAGAEVLTMRAGPGRPAVMSIGLTDADGRARYRAGVERGRVVVVADGFALQSASPIAVGRDATVQLQPARALRLCVVDALGVPVAGARVATAIAPELDQEVRTDGRGGAVLERLPTGSVAIVIDHPEHVPFDTVVDLPAQRPLDVALEPGLAIRGRVVCPDRPDCTDVLLEARRRADPDAARRIVAVAPDGTFAVRGLPDQAFDVFAWRVERGVTWSGRADGIAPGGEPISVTIVCDDPPPGRQ